MPVKPETSTRKTSYPFKPLRKEDIHPRVSAFIYGFPGSGKTYLSRTLMDHPHLMPALICVCDAGELTIKDLADEENFVVVRADLAVLSDVFNFLASTRSQFRSVFIDNITELHRSALIERARITSANKPRTEHEYTQNDYGIARNQILSVTSAFALKLPNTSVFVTSLAHSLTDETTGSVTIEPALAGKLTGEVPGYFDVVGYLSVETPKPMQLRQATKEGKPAPEAQRVLTVSASSKIPIARNRGGLLGVAVEDPNLAKIYEQITGIPAT